MNREKLARLEECLDPFMDLVDSESNVQKTDPTFTALRSAAEECLGDDFDQLQASAGESDGASILGAIRELRSEENEDGTSSPLSKDEAEAIGRAISLVAMPSYQLRRRFRQRSQRLIALERRAGGKDHNGDDRKDSRQLAGKKRSAERELRDLELLLSVRAPSEPAREAIRELAKTSTAGEAFPFRERLSEFDAIEWENRATVPEVRNASALSDVKRAVLRFAESVYAEPGDGEGPSFVENDPRLIALRDALAGAIGENAVAELHQSFCDGDDSTEAQGVALLHEASRAGDPDSPDQNAILGREARKQRSARQTILDAVLSLTASDNVLRLALEIELRKRFGERCRPNQLDEVVPEWSRWRHVLRAKYGQQLSDLEAMKRWEGHALSDCKMAMSEFFALPIGEADGVLPSARSGKSTDLRSVEERESETPLLDHESGEWIKAAGEAMRSTFGYEDTTLRSARTKGRKIESGAFGIDPQGRHWRRDPDNKRVVWYHKPTLKPKRRKPNRRP